MGLFDALGIGYSGLSTSQSGLKTTSHNISNVNTPGFQRQRVEQKVAYPIHDIPGDVGNGVMVEEIARVHDEFVYTKLKSSSANVEYFSTMEQNLQEIANGFPELDDLGIAQDLTNFYNNWSNLSQFPDDQASKIAVVTDMQNMTQNLKGAHESLTQMQKRLDEEFVQNIEKVNDLAKQIVNLNKSINKVENIPHQNANDLRDQRDQLELEMAKLVNISVFKGQTEDSELQINTDGGTNYTINIAGHNIVDGENYHLLDVDQKSSASPINSVFITDHNQGKTDITGKMYGGKIGAILDMRGDGFDESSGKLTHSKIQDYLDNLDSFTKGFIQKTNSIYASASQEKIVTDDLKDLNDKDKLAQYDTIKTGTFDVVVYDNDGNKVAVRSITIDENTTLNDGSAGSIVSQLNANKDDNQDNDGTNDLDDLFVASVVTDPNKPHVLKIEPKNSAGLYSIAIEDNGTNFAGVTGIHRLFEGKNSKDIAINSEILKDPALLRTSKSPVEGENALAQAMVSMQYEKIDFKTADGVTLTQSAQDFYRYTSTQIATDAQNASVNRSAADALHKTINEEMQSVSGVDMDEELMNLMKYQTAYQASAKIITTVDQMINTLLGIKQ